MNPPDLIRTNPHRQIPASTHVGLILADPPEAGWRMRTRSNEDPTAGVELLAAPDYKRHGDQA